MDIRTINIIAVTGVRFPRLIKAKAPGKWPLRAPTKKIRDELKMLQCKDPRAEKATRICTIHVNVSETRSPNV